MPRNLRIRLIDKHQEDELNRQDWASCSPEERVDAVSFLRRQFFTVQGYTELPRIQRVLKVVDRQG